MPGSGRLGKTEPRSRFYSTAELAAAAGVTPRTVRFYETRGLLKPDRAGSVRVFTYTDRARLLLILRGKRLGFSLDEIGDYLDLYGADPNHQEQLSHVVDKSRERITVLEGKLKDLQATIKELRHIEHEALTRLRAKQGRRNLTIQPFPKTIGTHAKGDRRHE
ncbi:MAG: MerR family DNA-binding transcriptional regulator [Rhodospirillaceae bacterium]|nr:MerR family DNA-binding transcriptional regulator [Rhodospirillaceae bacterium]